MRLEKESVHREVPDVLRALADAHALLISRDPYVCSPGEVVIDTHDHTSPALVLTHQEIRQLAQQLVSLADSLERKSA